MRSLAQQDLVRLRPMFKSLERRIEDLLATSAPNDSRNVILEVRAGTGGELRVPHADLGCQLVVVELEFVEWVGVGRRC